MAFYKYVEHNSMGDDIMKKRLSCHYLFNNSMKDMYQMIFKSDLENLLELNDEGGVE